MKSDRPSNTAKVIAASTILLANESASEGLVAAGAEDLCKQFLSSTWSDRLLARSASHPLGRLFWRGVERLALPGIMLHYWHRKRWIEARCRTALKNGCQRIVIFGAGFDTLAIRLAREFPSVEFCEIDHPATQIVKRITLEKNGGRLCDNLHLFPIDLSVDRLPEELLTSRKRTLCILEGVLMYLKPDQIDRQFEMMRSMAAISVQVIFSFMTKWPDSTTGFRPRSWLIDFWLRWRGEPFLWSLSPALLDTFLTSRRFQLDEFALTADFTPAPRDSPAFTHSQQLLPLDGENLVSCIREN